MFCLYICHSCRKNCIHKIDDTNTSLVAVLRKLLSSQTPTNEYMCVCVYVCVCVCVCGWARARVCACVRVCL